MEIKIIETSEIKSLTMTDYKTGVDWIKDLMGNHDDLPEYDENEGVYLMKAKDFEWWDNLVTMLMKAEGRKNSILNELEDSARDEFQSEINDINCDLEDLPGRINDVCDEWEERGC